MDIKEALKSFQEAKEKIDKYEYSRERLVGNVEKIHGHIKEIERLLADINPTINISVREKYAIPTKEIVDAVLEKIDQGTHVGTDIMMVMYPSMSDIQRQSVCVFLRDLCKTKNLSKRRDGMKVLFYR